MNDMDKMQAEAVNRAREMYSRRSPPYSANGFPSGYNGNMKTNPNAAAEKHGHPVSSQEHSKPKNIDNEKPPEIENKNEHIDSTVEPEEIRKTQSAKEKALIILLIALLNEEKASSSLLLALMYLII